MADPTNNDRYEDDLIWKNVEIENDYNDTEKRGICYYCYKFITYIYY